MKLFVFLSLILLCFAQDNSGCPQQIGGCYIFPPDDEVNRPIDQDPVDFRSDCIIADFLSLSGDFIRLDFGVYDSGYGIPVSVGSAVTPVPLTFYPQNNLNYSEESDCIINGQLIQGCAPGGSIPIPLSAEIEGSTNANPNPSSGDRHVSYLDTDNCMLYELYNTVRVGSSWQVSSSAAWNLSAHLPQRPLNWTSGDAAGLPIAPFLLRYEDLSTGEIKHPLRFTAPIALNAYVLPASHFGTSNSTTKPWYGMRIRLKSSFPETGYDSQSLIFIQALKKYGLIYADQGTEFYVSGVSSDSWDPAFFDNMNQITAMRINISNFEVVQSPNDPVRYKFSTLVPTCNSLTANPSAYVPNYAPKCDSFGVRNNALIVLPSIFVILFLSYFL